MKVGILTFHFSRNYGALLQAYGLRKAIESFGHDAVVIHYIPQHYTGYMSSSETSLLRLGWKTYGPKLAIERRLRTHRFSRFKRKELHLTRRCHEKEDLIQQAVEFDAIVVGSDQVWNLNFITSKDLCYFLDFPTRENVLYISYAACCGRKDQPSSQLANVSSLMTKFHSIGVRNDVTAEFVGSITDREPIIVADPTLLNSYKDVEDGYFPGQNYILVYVLEKKSFSKYEKVISEIRKKLGMPVWAIADGNAIWQDKPLPGADRNLFGVSPGRFLSLIKHASFVLTDSFHGTIFSVKYQKPFLTLNDGGWRNMRMFDLANRYGIGHRIIDDHIKIDGDLLLQSEDLAVIRSRFEAHKDFSYEFLEDNLGWSQRS